MCNHLNISATAVFAFVIKIAKMAKDVLGKKVFATITPAASIAMLAL